MCLDKLDKKTEKGTGVGWKVFGIDNSQDLIPIYLNRGHLKYNTWHEDKARGKIEAGYPRFSYPKGYHIFLKEGDTSSWGRTQPFCNYPQVRKVEYENVVASGSQDGFPVVVARKMLIHKKEGK